MEFERRADYEWGVLTEDDADPNPLVMLRRWMGEATAEGEPEPNAMVVATVGADGRPHARNVLLRGIGDDGSLWFFTNRASAKGVELQQNPSVALLFSWLEQHRQIRVEGTARNLDDGASDRYWDDRPIESRISAVREPAVRGDRRVAPSSNDWSRRLGSTPVTGRCDDRPTGVAMPSPPGPTSSGRAARAACTTVCAIGQPEPGERANDAGWVVERLAP